MTADAVEGSRSPKPATAMRSDYAGELRVADVGREVAVCGWVDRRREHGEHLAFIDLRDRTGVVQCVVDGAHDLRSEYVVRISGVVRHRPEGTVNAGLATGEVEVGDCDVEILARSEPPPFPVTDAQDVDEVLRLRHRYVDLRSDRMQRNLRQRALANSAIRRSMEAQGFVEVETPILVASTPEGARDFVVPSRLQPGEFYALPQSPQLFKQLCMVGGFDRYYQIARCVRDEDLRADRQFEFSQLDLEASFVGSEDVIGYTSEAVAEATAAVVGQRPGEFDRMTWHEAMERYGTDKPDLRFGLELVDLTDTFADTGFRAFQAACVCGMRIPGGGEWTRSRLDELIERAQALGAAGLVWMKVDGDRSVSSPIAKFLSEDEVASTVATTEAQRGDLLLLVAGEQAMARRVLGQLRLDVGRPSLEEDSLRFLWVLDFPLFEGLDEDGEPISAHHPFTMPHPDDLELLRSGDDPLAVRSQAYDMVLNGWELGSGSVRIHDRETQELVFRVLGIDERTARSQFGFLLDALRYGAPPHAGFALGIDRLVALLVGEENIREVIAFPKTQTGADPLTGAPTEIDPLRLSELGLRTLPRSKD